MNIKNKMEEQVYDSKVRNPDHNASRRKAPYGWISQRDHIRKERRQMQCVIARDRNEKQRASLFGQTASAARPVSRVDSGGKSKDFLRSIAKSDA
jgi:hypothetical protein